MPAVMRAAGFFVKKVRELAVAAQQVAPPAFAGPQGRPHAMDRPSPIQAL